MAATKFDTKVVKSSHTVCLVTKQPCDKHHCNYTRCNGISTYKYMHNYNNNNNYYYNNQQQWK